MGSNLLTTLIVFFTSSLFLIFPFQDAFGQRTIIHEKIDTVKFAVYQTELDKILQELELAFIDESAGKQLASHYFKEKNTVDDFITGLVQNNYPHITTAATPMFLQFSAEAERYLSGYYGTADRMELLGVQQQYGETKAMRKLLLYLNLHMCDGMVKSLVPVLVEYKDGYRIMIIDS